MGLLSCPLDPVSGVVNRFGKYHCSTGLFFFFFEMAYSIETLSRWEQERLGTNGGDMAEISLEQKCRSIPVIALGDIYHRSILGGINSEHDLIRLWGKPQTMIPVMKTLKLYPTL